MDKDDTAIAIGLGLLLLGGRKALASSRPVIPSSTSVGRKVLPGDVDGAKLVQRANQHAALAWAPIFARQHSPSGTFPDDVALALARWAGVESSGNPMETSRLDERGLMQAGPHLGGPDTQPPPPAFSQSEWVALTDPDTSQDEQATLALKYVDWLWGRAREHVQDPPTSTIDQIWYAKLYHQRPVDVRDGKMHGGAADMARELAKRWANDARAMHRLRAANVVAFGTPTP